MDRRKIIIIVSILILGTLLGGAYWYFSKKVAVPTTPISEFPGESGRTTGRFTGIPGEAEFEPGSGAPLPRLYELHEAPVAGVGFVRRNSINIAVRYIERGLGYVFETPLSTYRESRIVNETRPRIIEALWGNEGKSVVIRFLDEGNGGAIKTQLLNIENSSISFTQNSGARETQSTFLKTEEVHLPDLIPFMATSEDESDVFFYLENGVNASVGSISTYKNSGSTKIFSSSFTEWLPQFPNQKLVTLTTKPSATVPGYLYFIDQKTNSTSKILGGMNVLTTLTSHNGKLVLYSETKTSTPELFVFDTVTKETSSLNIKTLPEKCVWGNKETLVVYCAVPHSFIPASYPDYWYQGLASFSDDLWTIDVATHSAKKIMSPSSDFGAPSLDIINPKLSPDDGYLIFMNKISGTPWVYRIAEEPLPQQAIAPNTTDIVTTDTNNISTSTATSTIY